MKNIILLIFLCTFFIRIKAQEKPDSTYEKVKVRLQKDLEAFTTELKDKQAQYDNDLKRIDAAYKELANKNSNSELNEKLGLISERVALIEKQTGAKLSVKFKICAQAIKEMKKGLAIVDLVNLILDLQQQINTATNIWKDDAIRNGWDQAQDWTNIGGAAIAGFSLIPNTSPDVKATGVGIGVSVVGLGAIFKKAFGKEKMKHYELIQLSRKAFDDLIITNNLLKGFIADNERFDKELDKALEQESALQTKISNNTSTDKEISLFVISVVEKMNDYNKTLKQIPSYLAQLRGLAATYSLQYYDNVELKKVLDEIVIKILSIEDKYNNKVKPLLDVTPEIKTTLLGS